MRAAMFTPGPKMSYTYFCTPTTEPMMVVDLSAHADPREVGRHDLVLEDVVIEGRDNPADRGEAAVPLEDRLVHRRPLAPSLERQKPTRSYGPGATLLR